MAVKTNKRNNKPSSQDVAKAPPKKRVCLFCEEKKQPHYTDTVLLKKFISERSKIVPRLKTGACSKHQRLIAKEVKHARHLALLPFITKI